MFLYIFISSLIGWAFFRFVEYLLGKKHPHLKRYARAYARAAVLWGPLQLGWFYGLGQNYSGYVADTSKPSISSHWSDGGGYVRGVDSVLVYTYQEKLINIPHHHYGIGYKFSLGNPVGEYIYNLFGGWWVTYVMSLLDVLILGSIFSVLLKVGLW